jgi:molybdenum cofactor biosynthesis protein A
MPADGIELRPKSEMLTYEEILRLSRLFSEAGVTKIRLTGGEPLIRKDITSLVARLRALPGIETIAVTTNGLLLSEKLAGLQEAGVDLFNISLDTLRRDRFAEISRRDQFPVVMQAVRDALAAGYNPVKINCVVLRGFNEDELVDFVRLTETDPIEIRFIEYMPFGGNDWSEKQLIPYREMISIIESSLPPLVRVNDEDHYTSKTYRIQGFKGRVGFITSMSDDFCDSCNRLRLTADGHLKVCLFGETEINLRDAMRGGAGDEDLRPLIGVAVGRKKAAHAGMSEIARSRNRPMILIGG